MNEQAVNNYIEQIEQELQVEKQRSQDYNKALNTMAGMPSEENLIKYQLDMREELDRVYHLLRGDQIKEVDGRIVYVEPEDDKLKPFNDYGVHLIMNIMTSYLNKNTILSYYEEPEAFYPIILRFGNDLSDLILEKFLEMGMNTEEKIKLYPMIINELVDAVHNAYRRALFGRELNSLRTARSILQKDDNTANQNYGMGINQIQKKRSINPLTWFS